MLIVGGKKSHFVPGQNARTGFVLTSSVLMCPCCKESAWSQGDFNSCSSCSSPLFSLSLGRGAFEMDLQENSRLLLRAYGWAQDENGAFALS